MADTWCSQYTIKNVRFFFWTRWTSSSFKIEVTAGSKCWEASADEGVIRNDLMPKSGGMNFENFLTLTREALIRQDCEKTKFKYNMSKGEKKEQREKWLKLTWSIRVAQTSDVWMNASLNLKPKDQQTGSQEGPLYDMLRWLVVTKMDMKRAHDELELRVGDLDRQRSEALARFDELQEKKQKLEGVLMAKFVAVLNQKKAKTRVLKQEVDALTLLNGELRRQHEEELAAVRANGAGAAPQQSSAEVSKPPPSAKNGKGKARASLATRMEMEEKSRGFQLSLNDCSDDSDSDMSDDDDMLQLASPKGGPSPSLNLFGSPSDSQFGTRRTTTTTTSSSSRATTPAATTSSLKPREDDEETSAAPKRKVVRRRKRQAANTSSNNISVASENGGRKRTRHGSLSADDTTSVLGRRSTRSSNSLVLESQLSPAPSPSSTSSSSEASSASSRGKRGKGKGKARALQKERRLSDLSAEQLFEQAQMGSC